MTAFLLFLYAVASIWAYGRFRQIPLRSELISADNPALAVSFAGFILAQAIVYLAVYASPGDYETLAAEMISTTQWSLGGMLLLLGSLVINDKVVFPHFENRKELITDRNLGLAAVEAATFLGTALVLAGSLSPQESDLAKTEPTLTEPWLTLLYFVVGQALFLGYAKIYPKIHHLDLKKELLDDNAAVGVAFAGHLLSFAILIAWAKTEFDGLLTIVGYSLAGLALVAILRWLLRLVLLRGISLKHEFETDRNWGLALLQAVLSIVITLLVIVGYTV